MAQAKTTAHAKPNFKEAEIIRPHGRPLPEGLEARLSTYYVARKDTTLRVLLAMPPHDDPRGTLIFSPGRTEFIEKYFETVDDLTQRGFVVIMVDPRGQGLSSRLTPDPIRSYVRHFQDYCDDLAYVVDAFAPLLPKPHILIGHSMGGTIVLQSVISGAISPSAVICSAPMLGLFDLDTGILAWAIRGASAMGFKHRHLPFQKQRDGLPVPFNINKLTSDEDRYNAWAAYFQTEPRLRVGSPTFGWVSAAAKAMTYVNRNADKLKIPALIVAAGADPIVSPASNKDFAHNAAATFHVIPGALHELFLERDIYRDPFLKKIDQFLSDNAL